MATIMHSVHLSHDLVLCSSNYARSELHTKHATPKRMFTSLACWNSWPFLRSPVATSPSKIGAIRFDGVFSATVESAGEPTLPQDCERADEKFEWNKCWYPIGKPTPWTIGNLLLLYRDCRILLFPLCASHAYVFFPSYVNDDEIARVTSKLITEAGFFLCV